jgi:hypothetical protein
MTPTISQLQGAVRDFCTVLDQVSVPFFWESYYHPQFRNIDIPQDKLGVLFNSTIESSLLNIRIINDFFAGGGFPTDIKARHYGGFVPNGEFLTKEEREEINKHLAHLTIERADGFQKPW